MAELIAKEIQSCEVPSTAHVFFSAHGVPKSYVEEAGDPYQAEIEACAGLIMERLQADLGHTNPSPWPTRAGSVRSNGCGPTPTMPCTSWVPMG